MALDDDKAPSVMVTERAQVRALMLEPERTVFVRTIQTRQSKLSLA